MNKAELINQVSDRVEGGRTAATRAVEAVFAAIQEAVAQGEKVAITGFGVFEKVDRAARTGRNPATGEPVEVKASSVPKFRPGSEFKAYVSGAKEITRGVVTSAREAAAMGARAAADAISPTTQSHKPNAAKAAAPAKKAAQKAQKSQQAREAQKAQQAQKAQKSQQAREAQKAQQAQKATKKAPAKRVSS